MAKLLYCWRCKRDIPMLDESEWEYVRPREPADDQEAFRREALDRYFELTGFRETNIAALFHHRLALSGPPCVTCGNARRSLPCCARMSNTHTHRSLPFLLSSAEKSGLQS
jgi:hypothetical protein